MATDAAIDRGVHRTIILEFDVPSYHTDAGQQRGQEHKVNPRVRSIGIRPPPIPPEGRAPSRSAALAPPCGGIHPPDGVLLPDSFFPGRERVINAASGIIHGGRWPWARWWLYIVDFFC